MDNHHAINGKIHYFDGHGFTSLLYVYQRVWSATTSTLTPWWWRVGLLKPFAWQRVSHKDLKMFHKNGHPLTPCQRFRRPACARRFNRCGGNKFFGVTNSGSECEYNCGFLGWGISSQTGECDIAGYETKVSSSQTTHRNWFMRTFFLLLGWWVWSMTNLPKKHGNGYHGSFASRSPSRRRYQGIELKKCRRSTKSL